MGSIEQAGQRQQEAAATRLVARKAERAQNIAAIGKRGGLAEADTPERIAKRIDRLSRYYAGEPMPATAAATPTAAPEEVLVAALSRAAGRLAEPEEIAAPAPAKILERIINTEDFVDIRYLEAGVAAARAVCRVLIRDQGGRTVGYGSGSLISPQLVLTNHHVLESAEIATSSALEFNYQDGLDGQPLQPLVFSLSPDRFFLADEERDFALVAVGGSDGDLAQFGFNPLIGAEGKAIVGEYVTIVQHPRGEKKQVALRENQIVDLPEAFIHYKADTEPGSSGSPVFNDQWEVVAVHHASVPAPDHAELGGFLNEGIRVSRILQFVHAQALPPERAALLDRLPTERIQISSPAAPSAPRDTAATVGGAAAPTPTAASAPREAKLTVPLEVSVRIGADAAADRDAGLAEAIVIDPDYAVRTGYDPAFLGPSVALPALSGELASKAAKSAKLAPPGYVLPYHHFSVAVNKERKLAFFTAVNIDGRQGRRLRREDDRWFFDPRILGEEQTGEAVYAANDLDRGHLVRRLDPAWGASDAAAKLANDDTFHFTNCTPQHKDFNQRQTSWAGLEDYILEAAENDDLKVCVFTGPVFAADDDEYRGVRLPRQFWKVVAMVKMSGEISATAYLLSQESLIEGLEVAEEFSYGAYSTFQVTIERVEALTGLSFGALAESDPLARQEATTALREVETLERIVL